MLLETFPSREEFRSLLDTASVVPAGTKRGWPSRCMAMAALGASASADSAMQGTAEVMAAAPVQRVDAGAGEWDDGMPRRAGVPADAPERGGSAVGACGSAPMPDEPAPGSVTPSEGPPGDDRP